MARNTEPLTFIRSSENLHLEGAVTPVLEAGEIHVSGQQIQRQRLRNSPTIHVREAKQNW